MWFTVPVLGWLDRPGEISRVSYPTHIGPGSPAPAGAAGRIIAVASASTAETTRHGTGEGVWNISDSLVTWRSSCAKLMMTNLAAHVQADATRSDRWSQRRERLSIRS